MQTNTVSFTFSTCHNISYPGSTWQMAGCDGNTVSVATDLVLNYTTIRTRNVDTKALVVNHNNKAGIRVRYYKLFFRIFLYLSLSFFIFLYLSLSFFIFLYLSLSFFIFLYLSLSFFIFLYLSLSFFIFLYLSLSFFIFLILSLSFFIFLFFLIFDLSFFLLIFPYLRPYMRQ